MFLVLSTCLKRQRKNKELLKCEAKVGRASPPIELLKRLLIEFIGRRVQRAERIFDRTARAAYVRRNRFRPKFKIPIN